MESNDYIDKINQVIDYIEKNLTKQINLELLAKKSNFSKYHFSRIFTSIVGMTPIAFLNQKRLHKSLEYLVKTNKTILEISNLCGFESISNFNAVFKKYYKKTPSELRNELKKQSNIPQYISKKQEEISNPLNYTKNSKSQFLRRIWDMNVSIHELPNYEVAYVRHVGSYLDTNLAWSKLTVWAEANKLFVPEQSSIGISLDDPNMVDEYACRYDACITIPKGFRKEGHEEVRFKSLHGGLYALYPFYDTIDKFAIAYQSIFTQWLPISEYEVENYPCLEFCMNNPSHDPEGKCKIDLYIPIKKRIELVNH